MSQTETTRERLIDATHELARWKGFARTSVADVMKAADVGKGSFFHHFPNKDSLGLAVLERNRASFMQMIDDCLNAPTPLEGLDKFFDAALRTHRDTGFTGGCLWGNTALEMSDSNQAFTRLVSEVFEEWTTKLAATIRAGQEEGQIRADTPGDEIARTVVATIEGGIMMSRLTKQETPLKTCLQTLRTWLSVDDEQCAEVEGNEADDNKN